MSDPFRDEMDTLPEDHPALAILREAKNANFDRAKDFASLMRRWYETRDSVALLTSQLDAAQKILNDLEMNRLPQCMMESGLREVRLKTGERLTIAAEVYPSISDENMPAAIEWFNDTNHGDLLRNDIKLSFGRGQAEVADETAALLDEAEVAYERKTCVHWKTLQSFVKGELEDGRELPECIKWTRKEKVVIK